MSASVKAYFALKMIGDPPDAEHMRRAREAILARGGAARCNVFTRVHAGAVRLLLLARGAGDAGRDHAAAALVSVPPRQDFLLGPHRHRAAAGAAGAEAAGAQSEGRAHRRAVPRAAATAIGLPRRRRIRKSAWFVFFRAVDVAAAHRSSRCFPKQRAQRAIERAVAFVTERLNGEDGLGAIFPAMANSVMMFDALGYPRGPSAARDRAQIDREAPGRPRRRSLLPALRVAGLGYRPGLPRAARGRRRARRRAGAQGPRLAASRGRFSTSTAIGRSRGPTCGPAAGRSSTPIRTIPISTTPPSS